MTPTPIPTAPAVAPAAALVTHGDSGPAGARLLGVDAARGLAVLGMMAVHSLYVVDDDGGPTALYSSVAGRAAAVFAVLAAVGIAFTTGRRRVRGGAEGRRAAASLATRGLVVGLIGLALGYVDSQVAADILPYYALWFLLTIPLVFLPTPALVVLGVVVAAAVPVLSHLVRPSLPEPALDNPSFADVLGDPAGVLSELAVTGYYPALPWLAYACIGLAVGRLALSSARVAAALLGAGVAVAVTASLASWYLLGPLGGLARIQAVTPADQLAAVPSVADYVALQPEGVTPTSTWWWLATDAPHSSTPFDLVQTTASAIAVLGAMLLVGHVARPAAARLIGIVVRPLAAVGALTLTVYTAHLVFLGSPLDQFEPLEGYLLQVVVVALFAGGWLLAVGRGPLESLVRVLAHRAGEVAAGEDRRSPRAR